MKKDLPEWVQFSDALIKRLNTMHNGVFTTSDMRIIARAMWERYGENFPISRQVKELMEQDNGA